MGEQEKARKEKGKWNYGEKAIVCMISIMTKYILIVSNGFYVSLILLS